MVVIWNMSCKKCIFWARDIKSMLFFFNCSYISFQDMQSFYEFLESVINHYIIDGLHLFWDSFEWYFSPNKLWRKIFFLSCSRHCDWGLIVVMVYYQIGQLGRVFASDPGDRGSIPGWVIPKTQKMVLNISLLSTQH